MTFTVHYELWGWPQWIIIGLLLLSLFVNMANDGQPKKTTYSAGFALAEVAIWSMLLIAGGFFR